MVSSFFSALPEPAAFVPHYRAIGPVASPMGVAVQNQQTPIIYADVTIEEEQRDEMIITEHPVEKGAAISDHSFLRPPEVVIRAGWAASSRLATSATYPDDIYRQLLALQRSRLPFDVYTGNRAYNQMLLQTLTTQKDAGSEYILLATLTCRQVILVQTKRVSVGSNATDPQVRPASEQGTQSITQVNTPNTGNLTIQDPVTGNALVGVPDASIAGGP